MFKILTTQKLETHKKGSKRLCVRILNHEFLYNQTQNLKTQELKNPKTHKL